MTRGRVALAVVLMVFAFRAAPNADVRTDQKTHVDFAGVFGTMVNMFGGKAAREGVTSTVAVKGDRKATLNDSTGQIVDLAEEKVYDLDLKKKTYKVTTFDELRRRMEEARKKAEENARKAEASPQKEKETPQAGKEKPPEMQIDIDVKNTGMKKVVNGFDTHQVVITATAHEKGKPVEQSGGLAMSTDMWLTPKIAAMKEVADFDQRYAQKLYGSMLTGVSAEQMGAAMALYPMMKDVIGKVSVEGAKVDGTAIMTTVALDAVKSAEQMAQEAKQTQDDSRISPSAGISGALGGLARRATRKKTEGEPKSTSTIMTSTTEILKVTTDVAAADLSVPVGFKESK